MEEYDIQSLGEFGLIDLLTQNIEFKNASSLLGVGDDCAVVDLFSNQLLVSTDSMVEGIHFDLHYFPLKYLGYKLVSSSVSDIYAMNGEPNQILINIAISNRFSSKLLEELYSGIYEACEYFEVDVIGGDTTSSKSGLFLSATVLGECPENTFVTRQGAQPNDLVCMTGNLGAAYLGLLLLEREKQVFIENQTSKPEWEGKDYLLEKFLRPIARKDIIHALKDKNVIPSSMIDISDGLSSELMHICKQSNVGVTIYEDKIPFHYQTEEMARTFNLSPITAALNGGEEYELLFTISQSDFEKIQTIDDVHIIGHITDNCEIKQIITAGGNQVDLKAQGWRHF